MSSGALKIGSVKGINITLHWTFLIMILISIFLSPFIFLIIILLFVCVLFHEFSHSITALRNNIGVSEIILTPLGGASIIDELEVRPKTEFNISIAGPVMSLFLGGLFGILSVLSPIGIIALITQSLFEINILLGLLNLLPAFPMDGGRVFRSYLQRKRNFYDATIRTITISNYVFAALIFGTLAYLLVINQSFLYKEFFFFIVMITVIYLYGGAQAEKQSTIIKRDTEGETIRSIVSKHFILVDGSEKISALFDKMKKNGEHVIIAKTGNGYGSADLFRRDTFNKMAESVEEIITSIPTISENSSLMDAMAATERGGLGVAAVTRRGKLVGIVSSQQLQTIIALHIINKYKRKEIKS
jgi:Zn-dependent protease/CBS domain-containing protein